MSPRIELGTSRTVGRAPINCATLDEFCSNLADGHGYVLGGKSVYRRTLINPAGQELFTS